MKATAITSDAPAVAATTVEVAEADEAMAGDVELERAERGDKPKPKRPDKDKDDRHDRPSAIIKDIVADEEKSLRQMLEDIGTQGAFRVQVRRTAPKFVRVPGRGDVPTEGFLETYDRAISEEDILNDWGGGTYQLRVTMADKDRSFRYKFHRTLTIAGEPKVDRQPTNAASVVVAAPPPSESSGMAKVAMETMRDLLDRKDPPKGVDPAVQMVIDSLNRQATAREVELRELRSEMAAVRTQRPETDPVKDRLLNTLMDGNAGQIEAIRVRHEAELRQIKDSQLSEIKRIEDRHDRTVSELRQSTELGLATLKAGYEREIAALRTTSEVVSASTAASHNIQVHTLQADNRRLERDVEEMRRELTDLRAKKDKSIIEMLKEVEVLKEALGGDATDKGVWERIAELVGTPGALEGIANAVRGKPAVAAAPTMPVVTAPRIMRATDGNRYIQKSDGGLVPVKKKPKVIAQEDGTALEIPEIPREQLEHTIAYLERAYAANQEPHIVAMSARPVMPADILSWIQAHHSDQVSGVDLFLAKVAKLPGTSPLATQAGRNWVRKVGQALVGG